VIVGDMTIMDIMEIRQLEYVLNAMTVVLHVNLNQTKILVHLAIIKN